MIDGFLNKLCLELLKRFTVEFVTLLCLLLIDLVASSWGQ